MAQAPTSTKSAPLCTPSCPIAVCNPSCKEGFLCVKTVMDQSCKCPEASCEEPGFNIDSGNGNSDSSSKSIIGAVVGALAGIIAISLVVCFMIRRRRKRSVIMLGQDDSFEYSKHRNSSSSDSFGNRDVIRIAYIPSIIGESPINNPEPSVQSGGVLKPNFSSLRNQEQDKHSSVASLDEAVVMAVTSKATPQVMRLNAIKANQSDLIQRSNTLHSSNSIKRTLSQRRIAETKINANASSTKPPSPLGDIHSMYDQDSDADPFYSVSGSKRSSSAPSMLSSYSTSNPFMTEAELSTSPTSFSSFSNNTRRTSTAKANSRSSNPFLSVAESTMSPSSTSGSFTPASSQPGSPMSDTTAVFASIPITFGDHYNEDDPLSGLPAPNLRPWTTSSESSAMRDSTFSTISDSRSSTRGDGEEIMIFWEGH